MKTRPSSLSVLLAVLSAAFVSQLAAAPSSPNPVMVYALGAVKCDDAKVIKPGDSASKVARCLGLPDQYLAGSDTWVYRHMQCQRELENAEACTIVVITFSQDRVSDMVRVNEPAVQELMAKLATPAAASLIVAGKQAHPLDRFDPTRLHR
jgi:hypothetical protein